VTKLEDLEFSRHDLPRHLEIQVLDFMRMEWTDLFRGDAQLRSTLWEGPDATHLVRVAGDLLVSHAEVIRVPVDDLTVGGLGGMLTYPQFRGEGHGRAILERANAVIRRETDLGMLFCDEDVVPFYRALGWEQLEQGRVDVEGEPAHDHVMILGDGGRLADVVRLPWSW
jgi:GNAT superfamily N-acetyltransferase